MTEGFGGSVGEDGFIGGVFNFDGSAGWLDGGEIGTDVINRGVRAE